MKKIFITIIQCSILSFLFISCLNDDSVNLKANDTGQGGSTARFAVVGDFLYVVNRNSLKTYNVTAPNEPVFIKEQEISFTTLETIYPMGDKLLLGSTRGMYIYQIGSDGVPVYISNYRHVEACDPVASNGQYAYVTLRSFGGFANFGTLWGGCGNGSVDELQILDITDVLNPVLVSRHPLTSPLGVGVKGNTLFICDQQDGLKIYDASDPEKLELLTRFDDIDAKDVIVLEDNALVIAPNKINQYDFSDLTNIQLISSLPIEL